MLDRDGQCVVILPRTGKLVRGFVVQPLGTGGAIQGHVHGPLHFAPGSPIPDDCLVLQCPLPTPWNGNPFGNCGTYGRENVALLHRLVRLGHEVSFQNLMPVTL